MASPSGQERVDALRGAAGGLDRAAIRELLPYGDDFLFVDSVAELTHDAVEASFAIPRSAPYLDAHFTDLSIMPGVLIGEGLAQAGTLVVRYNLPAPDEVHVVALQVEKALFLAAARPGDRLNYRVELETMSRRAARLGGVARVGGKKVCRARLVVGIVPRDELAKSLAPAEDDSRP